MITSNFSETVHLPCFTKSLTYWYFQMGTRPYESLHPWHHSLVSTGQWFSDESHWASQSCTILSLTTNQSKTNCWYEQKSITIHLIIQNGPSLINQATKKKNTFKLPKPVISKVPFKGVFGRQSKTKRHLRPVETTSRCIFHTSQWFSVNAIDAIVAISWAHSSSHLQTVNARLTWEGALGANGSLAGDVSAVMRERKRRQLMSGRRRAIMTA